MHLSVTLSRTLPAVHIKPIKVPIECETFTIENGATAGLVLGREHEETDKQHPQLRRFCEDNRVVVGLRSSLGIFLQEVRRDPQRRENRPQTSPRLGTLLLRGLDLRFVEKGWLQGVY